MKYFPLRSNTSCDNSKRKKTQEKIPYSWGHIPTCLIFSEKTFLSPKSKLHSKQCQSTGYSSISIFTLQMKFLILFKEEMKSNIIIWKLKGRNTKYRNQIFYSVHTVKYPIYLTITKIHYGRNIISACSKYDANIMWSCVLI